MSPFYSPFTVQGATLALAWFFIVNVLSGAAVTALARRQAGRPADSSPGMWFALRVLPAASACGFVLMIFVPSYWRYEPRGAMEAVDLTLKVCAAAALAMLGVAAGRGISAWRRAARRTRAWMRTSRPLALPGTTIPAFEIEADAPVLALAGVLRPRLLVTRALVAVLTPEELAASIAHEIGHAHARDNLKRLVIRSAPDLFGATSLARAIERRWAAASEHHADQRASDHPATRCALASALVKVARLTPIRPFAGEPISTLIGGGDIASRVRHLLDDKARVSATPTPGVRWIRTGSAVLAIALLYLPALRVVHYVTEALVQFLP